MHQYLNTIRDIIVMNKAVYIGAGCDIIPVILLNKIDEFIYIDSLPETEYGTFRCTGPDMRFIPRLCKLLKANGFTLRSQDANYLEFHSEKGRSMKYYINTPFPEGVTPEIKQHLAAAESLIVCGYDPHRLVLELMPRLKNIICNTHTCYVMKDDEYECKEISLFNRLLHQNKYNYKLMKENNKYEYWNDKNIIPTLKNNYTISDVNTIRDIQVAKY